jgi:hypothetical protein
MRNAIRRNPAKAFTSKTINEADSLRAKLQTTRLSPIRTRYAPLIVDAAKRASKQLG